MWLGRVAAQGTALIRLQGWDLGPSMMGAEQAAVPKPSSSVVMVTRR